MDYHAPNSKCQLCMSEFSKKGMTRHIKTCLRKNQPKGAMGAGKKLFYFHVSDAYNNDYFLHLLLSENMTLEHLDLFLREIWLECCGHLLDHRGAVDALPWSKRAALGCCTGEQRRTKQSRLGPRGNGELAAIQQQLP